MTLAQDINRCFLRFDDRAERITSEQVADTFVSVGPLLDLMESRNNQVIYGRRGTGKTHALRFFKSIKTDSDDLAIYLDGQNLGSNGSIYNDASLPIGERATRLLVDFCSAIHQELLEAFTDPKSNWDLSQVIPALDNFLGDFSQTRIEGTVSKDSFFSDENSNKSTLSLNVNPALPTSSSVGYKDSSENRKVERSSEARVGEENHWFHFGQFAKSIKDLANLLAPKRLWVLVDEWTTIPIDIQPYLADMIRRAMFNVQNISVKIAAIEHRTNFKIDKESGDYIGFEIGAELSANINLDDYLVIDNDENRAKDFFERFLINHLFSIASEIEIDLPDRNDVINKAFTQENVFVEFIKASEGVPRDAMHILSLCAKRAMNRQISMPDVRDAAYEFFQTEKYSSIQSNEASRILLEWIRDEVIGERQTRAFLIPVGENDPIINRLFDRRALHILNKNRSAAHRPGERFIVYKLDYGLYVDLIKTDRNPTGLLTTNDGASSVSVPVDDARSFRRAILDLGRFYDEHPTLSAKSGM